jgi:hypothetical protein
MNGIKEVPGTYIYFFWAAAQYKLVSLKKEREMDSFSLRQNQRIDFANAMMKLPFT